MTAKHQIESLEGLLSTYRQAVRFVDSQNIPGYSRVRGEIAMQEEKLAAGVAYDRFYKLREQFSALKDSFAAFEKIFEAGR